MENSLVVRVLRILPISNPAIDPTRPVWSAGKGIKHPLFLASRGVERDGFEHRRSKVHNPVDDNRRALDGRAAAIALVTTVIRPRNTQLRHIAAIDLAQPGVACASGIARVMPPFVREEKTAQGELQEKRERS